jgi:prepilin peptidase CpaA
LHLTGEIFGHTTLIGNLSMSENVAQTINSPLFAVKPMEGSSLLGPFALAAAISSVFVWAGKGLPLPSLVLTAAVLLFVVGEDLRHRRIPNRLTMPAFVMALGLSFWSAGLSGLFTALTGSGVAFLFLFPAFVMCWMGAGDVKALMVLGAIWGPYPLLGSLWWMLIVGGVLGLAIIIYRGGLTDMLNRWWLSLRITLITKKVNYISSTDEAISHGGLPFGVAIGLGAVAYQLWGLPWK